MPQMIFVNLPITDLDRSKAFYTALGFTLNPQFSDETGACVVISDTIRAGRFLPRWIQPQQTAPVCADVQTMQAKNKVKLVLTKKRNFSKINDYPRVTQVLPDHSNPGFEMYWSGRRESNPRL